MGSRPSATDGPPRQPTEVADVQDDVRQTVASDIDVAVNEITPKPKPVTVTDTALLRGAFLWSSDTAGAAEDTTAS